MSTRTDSAEWLRDTEILIAQRTAHTGELCKWADYEIHAISGTGSFEDVATRALGFSYEHFEMRDSQAVSCDVCGGLFKEALWVMRRHRLQCGWG